MSSPLYRHACKLELHFRLCSVMLFYSLLLQLFDPETSLEQRCFKPHACVFMMTVIYSELKLKCGAEYSK